MKAVWNGRTIAESDDIVMVEGNAYFPASSLDRSVLRDSAHTSVCSWKGTANYYTLDVDGARNENAVWFYKDPKPGATQVSDRVAFWKGVTVS
jgi:uncharacterized protein (DUF427 family)